MPANLRAMIRRRPIPGTRRFIGPLTPQQQRRRAELREQFREAAEIAYARCGTMGEAFRLMRSRKVLNGW